MNIDDNIKAFGGIYCGKDNMKLETLEFNAHSFVSKWKSRVKNRNKHQRPVL